MPTASRSAVAGTLYNPEAFDLPADADSETIARRLAEAAQSTPLTDLMGRINGDLAVALADPRDGSLMLAGDRFGSVNIYYSDTGDSVVFSDSLKTLTRLPGFDRRANLPFLLRFGCSHYRMITNDMSDTPYRSIKAVPPAHVARVDATGVTLQRYWSMDGLALTEDGEDAIAEAYRDLLLDSVRRRLARSDRPGFTLSGGMDSTSVLSCAAHVTGAPLPAFTVAYDDPEFDESDDVACMKGKVADPWHTLNEPLQFDVMDVVQTLYRTHVDLVPTGTWLSHFDLCRTVADHGHSHIFDGLGGDELNAGEYEYFPYFFADLQRRSTPARYGMEVDHWVEHHDHPVFRKSPAIAADLIARLTDGDRPGRNLPDLPRLNRYIGTVNPDLADSLDNTPMLESPFASHLLNRTYQDLSRETLPLCLRIQHQNAEAFGLRPVSPFLDHRLVELMFSVPPEMKIRDGVTKVLLRKAMNGILPDEVRTRPNKRGWNVPAHTWFTGQSLTDLEDLVRSPDTAAMALFDRDAVLKVIGDHRRIMTDGTVEENHMMFMWQLSNLLLWARQNAVTF